MAVGENVLDVQVLQIIRLPGVILKVGEILTEEERVEVLAAVGPPAERPVWQKVRSRPKFTKPRCWHVDLVPKDPESSGLGELRPGRPPSSQGQVGLLGALVGRPMCA